MGMLDSLGNLGGLGQITKMFDAGNIVKGVVDSVLPKNMHVVGDVAGAFVDFKTGNFIGAAQLGMEAVKDLPQAVKAMQQQGAGAAANGGNGANASSPNLEPDVPKLANKPLDLGALFKAIEQLVAALKGQNANATTDKKTDAADAGTTKADTSTAKTDAKSDPKSGTSSSTTTTTTTTTHVSGWRREPVANNDQAASTRNDSGWRGEPVAPNDEAKTHVRMGLKPEITSSTKTDGAAPTETASGSHGASGSSSASASNGASGSSGSSPSNETAPSKPAPPTPEATPTSTAAPAASSTPAAGGGQTITSTAQLNSMSDAAIRDAVIHGRISPEFAKDQAGMMALQTRMQAISEMNNLMTAMMRAMHDMQMAVIQNIRI